MLNKSCKSKKKVKKTKKTSKKHRKNYIHPPIPSIDLMVEKEYPTVIEEPVATFGQATNDSCNII